MNNDLWTCIIRSRFLVALTILQIASGNPLLAMEGDDDPFNDPYLGTFKGFESDHSVSPTLWGSLVSYSGNVGTTVYAYIPSFPKVGNMIGKPNFSSWLGYSPCSPPQTVQVNNHEFVVLSGLEDSTSPIKQSANSPSHTEPQMTALKENMILLN